LPLGTAGTSTVHGKIYIHSISEIEASDASEKTNGRT
jgi:hypothetical protein